MRDKRRYTENRFVCWLIWWLYESHAGWPHRVIRVYSHKEYFCNSGHHTWMDKPNYLRCVYRALGMTFVWIKKLWDRGEAKLWPDKEKPEVSTGM